jgi:hypothetical protein
MRRQARFSDDRFLAIEILLLRTDPQINTSNVHIPLLLSAQLWLRIRQADSPIGWVRNTPQQPPWLRWSRNCPLSDGAKIRRKTVALIRNFCENLAAGIDAKRKLACSGSIHRHDPKRTRGYCAPRSQSTPLQTLTRPLSRSATIL